MAELLPTGELEQLFAALHAANYTVVGPTVRDGAIVYDPLASAGELPVGWTDEQGPGHYRLKRRDDERAFGFNVGPHTWKAHLFTPQEPLVQIRTKSQPPAWQAVTDHGAPRALLGVRACELAAIHTQDAVLLDGPFEDPRYAARRKRNFIIAVQCTEAGALCFCTSMGTGPHVTRGYDLRLTELDAGLLVEAGSDAGRALLADLPTLPAPEPLQTQADEAVSACAASMGRQLDTVGLPERLMGNLDHPRWDEVASRCLACGNCTSVCPTCFCFDITDTTDLSGDTAGRTRVWDSCFNPDHSYIHGSHFRPDTRGRYQQWMTHKLATWPSQFGTSGCVGCGRCTVWCPVGIDFVHEASTLAQGPGAPQPMPEARSYAKAETLCGMDGQLAIACRVVDCVRESRDVTTLVVEVPPSYACTPGQFNMLSLPGVGDVPISVSGTAGRSVEHTIRAVGEATSALTALRPGSAVGVRGPFGTGWPMEEAVGRPVVIIAGGIGLAPLRDALRQMTARPEDYPHVRLIYGARSPEDLLFQDELLGWIRNSPVRAHVTVDRADPDWQGNVGVVTTLIRRKHTPADGLYLLCGPEVMMRFALDELHSAAIPASHIYLSMERNMKCAAGLCGRCQYGPYFICKDGPVFRHDQIASLFGKPGF